MNELIIQYRSYLFICKKKTIKGNDIKYKRMENNIQERNESNHKIFYGISFDTQHPRYENNSLIVRAYCMKRDDFFMTGNLSNSLNGLLFIR